MYVFDDFDAIIQSYTLSTNWDITTASPENTLDVSGDDSYPSDIAFKTMAGNCSSPGRNSITFTSTFSIRTGTSPQRREATLR